MPAEGVMRENLKNPLGEHALYLRLFITSSGGL